MIGYWNQPEETALVLRDQILGSRHAYVGDYSRGRETGDRPHIGQVAVLWFAKLVDAEPLALCDFADAGGDREGLGEVRPQLFGELSPSRGQDVHVLRHAGLVDVGIDRVRAE